MLTGRRAATNDDSVDLYRYDRNNNSDNNFDD
jgi:hypothetical protein